LNFLILSAPIVRIREMNSDIRSFLVSTVPARHPGGRPVSGSGSRGGQTPRNHRDSSSRALNKRARSLAAGSESDEEEKERKKHAQKRVNWSLSPHRQQLEDALALVEAGKTPSAVERETGVPRTVLRRRASGAKPLTIFSHVGPASALTTQQELELKTYLLDMADRGFGKDVGEIRQLAVRLCKKRDFKATPKW
jgi:hypothetical protein